MMRTPPLPFAKLKDRASFISFIVFYLAVGIAWVMGSDWFAYFKWNSHLVFIESGKGIAFVLLSGLFFAAVLRSYRVQIWRWRAAFFDSENKFRELFGNANDGMLIMDVDKNGKLQAVLDVNEAFCRQLELSKVEVCSLQNGLLADQYADRVKFMRECLSKQEYCNFEWELKSKNGRRFLYEANAKPILFGNIDAILCIFRDVSLRKRSEKMLRQMTYYDHLTGLPNFRLFEERFFHELRQAQSTGRMIAVIIIDIDHFRVINDTMGRVVGDKLLCEVAARIKRVIRDSDLLARMDGDDFKLLWPRIAEVSEVTELAETINRSFDEGFLIDGYEIHITVHIGGSIFPKDGEDIATLCRNANFAMYRSMESRSAFQLYEPGMNPGTGQAAIIESDLKKALLHNQFEMFYQPQLSLETGRIIGAEALIRWRHPEKGLITPGEFIPVAEETGMIIPLGEWVLKTVCKQHKSWCDQGFSALPLAVNLSIRQFMQQNILDVVKAELEKNEMPAEYLVLEITESMTMNSERASQVLRQFKDIGVQINLDDFGMGYSSLNHLKRFPLDKIKIDRSFVRDMLTNQSDASIVSTIISLAHHLGLKVIAEGVENCDQSEYLIKQRCDEVQGYFYSPPITELEFRKMLSDSQNKLQK